MSMEIFSNKKTEDMTPSDCEVHWPCSREQVREMHRKHGAYAAGALRQVTVVESWEGELE